MAATNISVNSTSDTAANDGLCTLREAITSANTDAASGAASGECAAGSGADTITFSVMGTINLTGALPDISADVSVVGPGTNQLLTVMRNTGGNYRVLTVAAGVTANISSLALSGGDPGASQSGGGLSNSGTLNLTAVAVSGNTAFAGGGIVNQGTLTLYEATVSGNRLTGLGVGGGILHSSGTLNVTNSTVSGNNALAFDNSNNPLTTDQRGAGFPRVADAADADTTQTVDIGAFEAHPTVEDIASQATNEDTPRPITLNVGDASLGIASVTATSNNASLFPSDASHVSVTGTGSTRTLTLTPEANLSGLATITATVTVTRTGNTPMASVDYATDDGGAPAVAVPCPSTTGLALDRCDFTKALGTLGFAAGETEKTFKLLVGDDSPESTTNPIDGDEAFVRQHYRDFLNREPDAPGLSFWTGEITSCRADRQCKGVKRVNVSAAFFLSIEFQETGYLVYRTYKAAYGDATSPGAAGTVPVVRLDELLPDTQRIGRGVAVGQGTWRAQLGANKQAYALGFVRRRRFLTAFPPSMTAAGFVDRLVRNAGLTPTPAERDRLPSVLGAAPADAAPRAEVLRSVAEDGRLRRGESDRAFVLMEYFGYLRRNPGDAPEAALNYAGWEFWLDKLEEFDGNYIQAEMARAFITSIEYRQRFGQ